MATAPNIVKLKRSAVADKVPTTTDLALGELALNTNDGVLYLKKSVSAVESIVRLQPFPAGGVNGYVLQTDGAGNFSWVAQSGGGGGSTYTNANVELYIGGNLGAFQTYANTTFSTVANAALQATWLGNLESNAATQAVSINTIDANLGAYQTFANGRITTIDSNLGTATTNITTLFSNAATQATGIDTITANLGAYQTYGNLTFSTVANAGTQQTEIDELRANITAANTLVYSNANVSSYLTVNPPPGTYSNANVAAYLVANPQGGDGTYSNANVTALLSGNTVTTISTTGNITTVANLIAPNYLFANGVNILSTVTAGSPGSSTGQFTPNVATVANTATAVINVTSVDQYNITALDRDVTFSVSSTVTPDDGQRLLIRIRDDGTARNLTWTQSANQFRFIGITPPTITSALKLAYIGCIYNAFDSRWDVISSLQQP
jgi:hypothetical protein